MSCLPLVPKCSNTHQPNTSIINSNISLQQPASGSSCLHEHAGAALSLPIVPTASVPSLRRLSVTPRTPSVLPSARLTASPSTRMPGPARMAVAASAACWLTATCGRRPESTCQWCMAACPQRHTGAAGGRLICHGCGRAVLSAAPHLLLLVLCRTLCGWLPSIPRSVCLQSWGMKANSQTTGHNRLSCLPLNFNSVSACLGSLLLNQ